ncbi:GRP family sugar transporter [Candidatus Enterococcus leclercqii]|uniref:GRP family sugar transporter n=1 Tax=Candidatus Enterococcus leclercqii TaxID=1857218 RepID=UPI00137AD5F8|nr:GRP family sugar transporter [Enterococcus sp. CU9D]KAF1292800.1 glucose transporter GlcU [Enterococcus sp. CU9D]
MELLIALVPMFAWGSTALVSGKMGGSPNQQTLGMTIGAFFFSIVVFFVLQPTMTLATVLFGFLSGVFWSIGQKGQFQGMHHMGISVALPVSTGMQLILNTIAGAVLFGEWRKSGDFLLGGLALALLMIGSYYTSRQDLDREKLLPAGQKMFDFGKGFRALLISTLGYGAYTIILTWADLDPAAVILPQSVGMVAGAFLFTLGDIRYDRYVLKNNATGLLWGLGNVCMLMGIQSLGLAVSFSLSQMGIIISTLGGIFLLGERKTKKELVYVVLGCLFVIGGGILLGYMKSI